MSAALPVRERANEPTKQRVNAEKKRGVKAGEESGENVIARFGAAIFIFRSIVGSLAR
jgi:hypothetical protein